ncbi:type IV toxin-antitoxin system AbiEi family antitoxin domain-containing protein [Nocardioides sp. ChNu-99]|nr:type IV toxin-antitoxin system AbiEi family antitoxin domain-containing protein [Nocardioides sp. ChNu-99]MDF9716455.1 type IV toxin-antitoxin system AbiEi family antitoxin domain-containing protein [Nocardioides sp. ChNu-99]
MSLVLDLADLAVEQWGLLTTAQARSVGASPQAVARLANEGVLERVTHGVYRVIGTPPSPIDDLRAAWLALDPARRANERRRGQAPVVVSYRSAAAIHGLGDLEADELEFTSAQRKQTRRPDVHIHRGQVDAGEWTVVDGLPVTTVVRTVSDLAAARLDGGHLATVVRDAITLRQTDDRQLVDVLRPHAHRYNAPMGDGEALLSRLLQESGISEPIERAVERVSASARQEFRPPWNTEQPAHVQQLSEQFASIQRALAPAARVGEQLANSPAMQALAAMAERVSNSAALAELASQHAALVDSPAMKAITELAKSPAMQELAKQFVDVAELTRAARSATEGLAVPEIEGPKVAKRDEIEQGE